MHTYFFDGELKGSIVLNEVESNHAVKVMRSKLGQKVSIINGVGSVGVGEIAVDHPKKCEVLIQDVDFKEFNGPRITIAIAPTKSNDRIEFFIEKATEIGVFRIIPLLCKNNERDKIKIERWEKVALSATKQSKRVWLPKIANPIRLSDLLNSSLPKTKLIAYCEDLPEVSISHFYGENEVIVLIGPEGDFTTDEVLQCEKSGFQRVNLGVNRLRTETAGLVALTKLM